MTNDTGTEVLCSNCQEPLRLPHPICMLKDQHAPSLVKVEDLFVSRDAYIIYLLTKTDGHIRQKGLGIKKSHFYAVEKATEWRNEMYAILESSGYPYKEEAYHALNRVYKEMIGDW